MKKIICLLSCGLFLTSCDPYIWMGVLSGLTYPTYTPSNTSFYSTPSSYTYSSGSSYSSSSSSTNTSTTSTRTPKTCGLCDGKGWTPTTKGVSTFGSNEKKWCSGCGKNVPINHYHETCPSCKGKGVW